MSTHTISSKTAARAGSSRAAVRPCPMCGGVEVHKLYKQSFVLMENHPLSNGYTVVHCGPVPLECETA